LVSTLRFTRAAQDRGNIAFVSQSGALCTAILEWAQNNDVGFPSIVSMGLSMDVDLGEILDYLVADPAAHSILMYSISLLC
jgi:acetyltransferase